MLDNKIGNSVTVLETIKNDTNWTGAASSYFNESITDLISSLNAEKANLGKFQEALTLLEELKIIDEDIESLKNSFVSIPEDADDETRANYTAYNSNITSSINTKTEERNTLRNKIISILSEFGVITDVSVIEIPNIEGAKVLYEYDTGCIYELYTTNGQRYEAFIPNEIIPSAPIVVYDPGDGGGGAVNSSNNWKMFRDEFETNGYQYIVIRSLRRDNSQYYNDLCDRLNLEPERRVFISHSGGTTYNFYEYRDLLDEDSSVPGVIAVMDGYTPASWFKNQGVTQKLIDSETVVLAFHQNWQNDYAKNYKDFARDGVNMLIFSDQSEWGHSHGGVNLSLTENGVADFITGDGPLPDNYKITYYNAETDEFTTVDYTQVSTLDDVYNFFGVERS